jgi:malonyl-CoA O-methyltransferase
MPYSTRFINKHLIQNFNRAAKKFAAHDFLYREINQRQLQRLDVIPLQPKRILDCGCGIGDGTQLLFERFRKSEIISLDFSGQMLQEAKSKKRWRQKNSFIRADAGRLPFASSSFDFVYSNLMLHWCSDLNQVFSEWQRVLKPNGLLMFTVFGPDTLQELRQACLAIEPRQALHSFIDMHDLGDALIINRLLDPVMDVENITLEYTSAEKFLRELRALGGRNLNSARLKHLFGKSFLKQLEKQLEVDLFRSDKLPISFEIIYGHAWASELSQQSIKENVVNIPVRSIKIKK